MINKSKNILLLSFFVLLSNVLLAGNWDAILTNNNISAEKKFLKILEKDSTNFDALVGMIYLSELKQDKLSYDKYIDDLVINHPDEINLFLYQYKVDLEYDVIDKLDIDNRLKLQAKLDEAERLFTDRKFKESKNIVDEISSELKWSLIGPFENLSGSGFDEVYLPELKPSDNNYEAYDYVFQNKWLQMKDKTPLGGVYFPSYLPKEYNYSTFYAKTFFSLDEKTDVFLNLSRNTPLKIWIDGQLVFSESNNMSKIYDFEQLEMALEAGSHTILVKSARINSNFGKNNLFSMNAKRWNYKKYYYNSSSKNLDYYFDFLIRLTDNNGEKLKIGFAENSIVTDIKPNVVQSNFDIINQLKQKIETSENKWPYYYLIQKAFVKLYKSTEGEEYLYRAYNKNKSMFYMKYLLGKTYEKNNKASEVYLLLENINHKETPMFSVLYEKFDAVDKDTNEKLYLQKLDELNDISPSNSDVIAEYLDFYKQKGMNTEKRKYLEKLIKDFPVLKEDYEEYLEDENYKPEIYKATTDEEKKEKAMNALASLDTSFYSSDYHTLIKYYKNQEINDSVLFYYDELIKIDPSTSSNITEKCKFLYGLERYDEAQEELKALLEYKPFNTSALTMLGDILFDLKQKEEAKKYYEAVLAKSVLSTYSYSNNGVLRKIRKITPEKDYSNHLKAKSIDQVIKDKKWANKYEDEDAFIIYSSQDIIFKEYNKIDITNKVAIKIISEEGSREFTELDYGHFGNLTTVKVIKENNVEVVPDYSGSYIVFKNLVPGDIIIIEGISKDIGYIKNSTLNLIASEFVISKNYPVYYSKFEMIMPEDVKLYFSYFNMEEMNTEYKLSKKDDIETYTWSFYDVEKYIYEEGALYDWELKSFIAFTNIKSWNDVAEWYSKTTYKKLEFNYELREIMDSLNLKNDAPKVQVEKLYNYITEFIDYSNVSFLQSNFVPKSSNITCSEKIGDCKDVATLMISFLQELNIESYYSLVRTNNYSYIDFPPSLRFDHVIVAYKIGDDYEFMDLTSDYAPSFALNDMDIGAFSLLIKDSSDIFNLPNDGLNNEKNNQNINSEVVFNADNSISISSKAEYYGLIGGSMKQTLNTTSKEELNLVLNDFVTNSILKNPKLESFKFENLTEITPSLFIDFELSAKDFTYNINDLVIFNVPYLNPLIENNAFQADERNYDLYISFILNTTPVSEVVSMTIPSGYKMSKLPKDVIIDNEFVSYSLSFKMDGDKLITSRNLQFKNRRVPKELFEDFKISYNKIIKSESQKMYYSEI